MIYTLTLNPAVDRELVVPEIVENTVLRATSSRVDFGGKGFNVSRMVRALGGESVALGFVGGKSGERLADGLAAAGIKTAFTWLAEETRTNVSIVTNDSYIKVNESGPTVTKADMDQLTAQIRTLAQANDWWVLSGSLPPGVSVDVYARLTAVLKEANAFVFLDTSGEALVHGIEAGPDWIKPNLEEAVQLTQLDDPLAAAKMLQKRSPSTNILLSLGEDGAILRSGKTIIHGTPPTIEARNPIGAGDSLVGGMVWSLHRGDSEAEAMSWGMACGAAAASLSGTQIGSLTQVETLRADVVMKKTRLNEE